MRVLVANLTEFAQEITLEGLDLFKPTLAILDETTYEDAAVDDDWVASSQQPVPVIGGRVTLMLKPYAVAVLDGSNR